MRFGFVDVLRAPRVGFSAKKMWVGFLGLFLGTICYSAFAYFAYVCCPDWTWVDVWRQFKYVPVPVIGDAHLMWYSWILWGVGVSLFVMFNFIAIGAISKLTIEQLRGDEFYEVTDSIKYAMKQGKAIVLSPVALIIFIAGLILVGMVCGLIGRIPYVGPVLAGLFFIPVAFGAIFTAYLGIILILSLLLGPSIGGATDSDTFDCLFEIFSCLNDQTWRVFVWEIFVAFCAFVGVGVFGWLTDKGLLLMKWSCGMWAGTRMIDGTAHSWWNTIWQNGIWYLPPCPPVQWAERVVGQMVPVMIYPQAWMKVDVVEWIGSFCVGLSFYFVGFFVLAYGISTWGAGQTLIYAVLAKIKDDKNLLEKKEEEFEEEMVEEEKAGSPETGSPEKGETPEKKESDEK